MTNYTIHGKNSAFSLSYDKRGRLKWIRHTTGDLSIHAWRNFVRSLPEDENGLEDFKTRYPMLEVRQHTKTATSQYKHYVSDWFLFYFTINDIEPKFTATDGKCIREIMKHFEKVSDTPENARAAWQALLSKWNTLPEFYRKKTELTFINARLNEIITHLKDEGNTKAQADRDAADLRR